MFEKILQVRPQHKVGREFRNLVCLFFSHLLRRLCWLYVVYFTFNICVQSSQEVSQWCDFAGISSHPPSYSGFNLLKMLLRDLLFSFNTSFDLLDLIKGLAAEVSSCIGLTWAHLTCLDFLQLSIASCHLTFNLRIQKNSASQNEPQFLFLHSKFWVFENNDYSSGRVKKNVFLLEGISFNK